ncbi:HigA family addiction module antitoxin [Bartonella queenslandensis]|uniref:HigA family addiction module antitoxin n=1 Tax=Bartonella queenslandensis TaxID=481138 RepID=UPI0002F3F890|nr:HigA family addiction module antitoxin [Bartonella queenslandensis]
MMHNHPHPGFILRDEVIEELGLTVSEAAQRLAMSRASLSRIVNGHAGISTDLAIRLEMAGISTARAWLSLQTNFNLWQAKQRKQPHIERLVA